VELTLTAMEKYDIFNLPSEIRVNILPRISPQISSYISGNPNRDLVLNLSSVKFIDSSTIKLLVNLHKRMESDKKKLYLLKPSSDVMKILSDVKLDGIFSFLNGCDELDKAVCATGYAAYLPFTHADSELPRLNCRCSICGSDNVIGYLINCNDYDWKWEDDFPYPTAVGKNTGAPLDVISLLPIVCADCFMCSTDIADFSTSNDGNQIILSTLRDETKTLLIKSAKNRKKMAEEFGVIIGEDFFLHPRKAIASYNLYMLAESCIRCVTMSKIPGGAYWIGYYNYLAVKFAPTDKKDALIDNCRTWLTQVINEKARYNALHVSKSYFILIIAAISMSKEKEAAGLFTDFSALMASLPDSISSCVSGFNSPAFWFSQAKFIWEKQSAGKST